MGDIIARIKHKLAYLQQHDDGDVTEATYERKWPVERHYPYEVDETHTEDEIAGFEATYHIRLPEDYRRFLLEVGRSGPNPGYHMYSPLWDMLSQNEADAFFEKLDHSDEEIDEDEWWKEDAPILKNLDHPFPFNDTMTDKGMEAFFAEHGIPSKEGFFQRINDGYLWLVYSGCTCWYILIITGEARGQIWYMDAPTVYTPVMLIERELFDENQERHGKVIAARQDPLRASTAQRVTFTQWYEAWLNKQIRIAQEHWRKRERDIPPLALDAD